ncbi:hypothetical protein AMJ86_07515 [bacterium SM23_57]|nr:MAG: hypothetical protein AMJ86_07515 [bacterium SM23_57]
MKTPCVKVLILLVILGALIPLYAQDSLHVSRIGCMSLGWDFMGKTCARGDYAYIATGYTGLRILDMSNPSNPIELGYYNTPESATSVCLQGSYAYVADWWGDLRVIDVSNPSHPSELTWVEAGNTICDVACDDNYVYSLDRYGGLKVIDTSNPNQPEIIGHYQALTYNYRDLTLQGDYIYVLNGSLGLAIVDISNPYHPSEMSVFYNTLGYDSYVLGDYAYIADGDLHIINISDPTNPFEVICYPVSQNARSVSVIGSYAYIGTNLDFLIMDVSNPANPTVIMTLPLAGIGKITLTPDYGLLSGGKLYVINTTTPSFPYLIAQYSTDMGCRCLTVSGNYAYISSVYSAPVAHPMARIRIVDISSPHNLTELGSCYTLHEIPDMKVSDGYAYVANGGEGLRIVDVRDPTNPMEVACYNPLGHEYEHAHGLDVVGDYTYVVVLPYPHLYNVNTSNPLNPVVEGAFELYHFASDVVVKDEYAYVAADVFYIIDVEDPFDPIRIAGIDVHGTLTEIAVSDEYVIGGNYVFALFEHVENPEGGFYVIDVSDPEDPEVVSECMTPNYSTDIDERGLAYNSGYLFIADAYEGLQIYDVTDPANPVVAGYYDIQGDAKDVKVVGNRVYLLDRFFLHLLDFDLISSVENNPVSHVPTEFGITSVYHNPFNPVTSLIYSVPTAGNMSMVVYDILGREVETLFNGYRPAGIYRHNFNGSHLSSGIYFVKMSIGDVQSVKKVVLLK